MLRMVMFLFLTGCAGMALSQSRASDPLATLSLPLRVKLGSPASDSFDLSLSFRSEEALKAAQRLLPQLRVKGTLWAVLRTNTGALPALAAMPGIRFISESHTPREELSSGASDPTLNAINTAHARFDSIDGKDLHALVKERLFDTADIDLRGRVFRTGLEAPSSTAHASLMATLIAGAGNSSPLALGAAPAARLGSVTFLDLFPEPDSLVLRDSIAVQNHSYGTEVENFYGNEAAAYDAQAQRIPFFLPVFSSGNSGNVSPTTGPYAGVGGVANLTGNFKLAKNILTVGSLDSAGALLPLSSRGPAYDGRIKPELMAYGEDGSSGAAALVSGAALLVGDACRRREGGSLPPASRVKAILVNSADEAGVEHPDYASGFGSLNAERALRTVAEGRYADGLLTAGASQSLPLSLPAGMQRLKITLAWTDPAALPNAGRALVNDLDLQLSLPAASQTWLPWVLDPTPNAASLQAPAQRKTDTLNNVEQITVDLPAAGNYLLTVRGTRIQTASQSFSLAWELDTAGSFSFTYPAGRDALLARNTHRIRWQTEQTGPAFLEYATNGGNWRLAASVPDLAQRSIRWTLPDTLTTAVLRMRIPSSNSTFLSDSFIISPQPNLETGFDCPDSFLLHWKALPVDAWRLYALQGNYLQALLQTADTALVLKKALYPYTYFALAPVKSGREGWRSASLNYGAAGAGCYIRSFFLQAQDGRSASFAAELGSLYGVVAVELQKRTDTGFQTVRIIPSPASLQYLLRDSSLQAGENLYRLRVVLASGASVYSTVETVYAPGGEHVWTYPNPVRRGSPLKLIADAAGRYRLELIDLYGRVLKRMELNSSFSLLDTGGLAPGLYILRLSDGSGKILIRKFTVY